MIKLMINYSYNSDYSNNDGLEDAESLRIHHHLPVTASPAASPSDQGWTARTLGVVGHTVGRLSRWSGL